MGTARAGRRLHWSLVRLNPPHAQAMHNESLKFKMSGSTVFAGEERDGQRGRS